MKKNQTKLKISPHQLQHHRQQVGFLCVFLVELPFKFGQDFCPHHHSIPVLRIHVIDFKYHVGGDHHRQIDMPILFVLLLVVTPVAIPVVAIVSVVPEAGIVSGGRSRMEVRSILF